MVASREFKKNHVFFRDILCFQESQPTLQSNHVTGRLIMVTRAPFSRLSYCILELLTLCDLVERVVIL